MNMIESSCAVVPTFANHKFNGTRPVLRFVCSAAITLALMICGASSSWGEFNTDFTWVNGVTGNWSDTTKWNNNYYDQFDTTTAVNVEIGCTNLAIILDTWVKTNIQVCTPGTGFYPGEGVVAAPSFESAFFTNAGTYTVTFDSGLGSGDFFTGSNVFATASNATASVTLNFRGSSGGHVISRGLIVGTKYGSTTTLIISNLLNGFNVVGGQIGQRGLATMIINDGTVNTEGGSLNLGTGDDGRGILILSGPTANIYPGTQLSIGNDPQQSPQGSLMILTNGGAALFKSSFRVGSGSGKGGSSNNTVIICAGSTLTCDSGPETIGLRSTGVTNSDGGTLCFNNLLLVKSGGTWACALSSTKSVVIGDAAFFGQSQSATASPPAICTGNVLRIEQGGVVTGASVLWIAPTNTLDLQGARLEANVISNYGTMIAYGTHRGEERVFEGGKLKTRNSLGKLIISNGLWMVTNSILDVEVGSAAAPNPIDVYFNGGTNRLEIDQAILNITPVAGFGATSIYDLITFSTNVPPGPPPGFGVLTNALGFTNFTGFAAINGPNTFTYSIDVDTNPAVYVGGRIRLLLTRSLPFRIVSAARSGNDVVLKWTDNIGMTGIVQSTTGSGGNFVTNSFADISGSQSITPAGGTNTYTHVNGATGSATRYYRIRRVP
jgi:hypothetical protein